MKQMRTLNKEQRFFNATLEDVEKMVWGAKLTVFVIVALSSPCRHHHVRDLILVECRNHDAWLRRHDRVLSTEIPAPRHFLYFFFLIHIHIVGFIVLIAGCQYRHQGCCRQFSSCHSAQTVGDGVIWLRYKFHHRK